MAQSEPVIIKIDSKHEGFEVKRWIYNFVSVLRWLINVGVVLNLSFMLYKECLFNEKVNPIVVTYFCLISLGCFLNIGIPIDKLANVSLTGK
jgi:hypothetical protein